MAGSARPRGNTDSCIAVPSNEQRFQLLQAFTRVVAIGQKQVACRLWSLRAPEGAVLTTHAVFNYTEQCISPSKRSAQCGTARYLSGFLSTARVHLGLNISDLIAPWILLAMAANPPLCQDLTHSVRFPLPYHGEQWALSRGGVQIELKGPALRTRSNK